MVDFKAPHEWSDPVGGIDYRTTATIDWGIGSPQSKIRLILPAGRRFNVSIPRLVWWLFDPHDPRYRLGGLVHDHLIHVDKWQRIPAAGEFHNALRAGGTPIWRSVVMWLAVGLFRYPSHTKEEALSGTNGASTPKSTKKNL